MNIINKHSEQLARIDERTKNIESLLKAHLDSYVKRQTFINKALLGIGAIIVLFNVEKAVLVFTAIVTKIVGTF